MTESMKSLPGYRPVASLRVTSDGKIRFANDHACELFGYPEEEFKGLRISDIDPGMTEEAVAEYFRQLPAEGPAKFNRRLRRKDGSVSPALLICELRETGNGAGGSIVAFIHDLSAEERMERALREKEFLLRKSQEIARLGTFTLDVASRTWVASPVLRDIGGIPDEYPETIDAWLELVAPDQREEMLDLLERHVTGGRNHYEKEYRILRHDNGEERWLHCRGELEFDG